MRRKNPQHGDFRAIKKFAIFPIETKKETRWLETCYILQCYYWWHGWQNCRFITKEEYLEERLERAQE